MPPRKRKVRVVEASEMSAMDVADAEIPFLSEGTRAMRRTVF